VLYIKKEKVLDKRALKGNQGAADNSATDNKPVFKEIRPVKLDFSATNFKAKVTGWRLSIEKKADTLFPTVCDTARGIAGIVAAAVVSTQLEHQDPQILARANLASEDEDEHEDNTQPTDIHTGKNIIDQDHSDEHHRDNNGVDDGNASGVDEDHNNGVDDGNASGVDEDHNNGVDDGNDSGVDDHNNGVDDGNASRVDEDHNNGGDDSDGHDEEDEDIGSGPNGSNDHISIIEEASDLTEIGSSSDVTDSKVSAPRSRRKGVQRKRN
jgi:hypothetical protein